MKKKNVSAVIGAFLGALFVSLELGALLFGIAFVSLGGIMLQVSLGIALLLTTACFIVVYRLAYQAELELLEEVEKPYDRKERL